MVFPQHRLEDVVDVDEVVVVAPGRPLEEPPEVSVGLRFALLDRKVMVFTCRLD